MIRLIYRVLATAMGVLGLAGCSATTADEYGQPYATYRLDGHVVTANEKQPITGIEIYLLPYGPGRAVTDTIGIWKLSGNGSDMVSNCSLYVRDVDADSNGGKFQDKRVPLTLTKTADGSGWYHGTYEQHDIQIELDPDSTK
jgi:putative lipoprotein (rSAM/lipoprotein system)